MSQPEAQDERSDLRRRAEALLEDPLPELEALSAAEARRLLEELRVHQVELELQNQTLRQAQLERELLLEQYTDLYDSAPIGYFSLDENGVIRRANLTGAAMLGQDRAALVGQRLSRYVAPSDQETYHFYLVRLFQHEDRERCQVRLDLMDDGVDLSQSTRMALFRIYQEGLDNAARHAGAERVWVRLRLDDKRVTLEIRDDGRGFEPPERWVTWTRQGRLGLLAARERAEAMGGCLQLVSAPDEGTRLRVTLPRIETACPDPNPEESA